MPRELSLLHQSVCLLVLVSALNQPSCLAGTEPDKGANGGKLTSFYDGRFVKTHWDLGEGKAPLVSKEDAALMEKQAYPQAKKLWQAKKPDLEPEPKVLKILQGAFTGPGKQQRLVFYQYGGYIPMGIYGLVVIDGGKIVAHRCFEFGSTGDIRVTPDLTGEGKNQIALETWSMHQGYRHGGG